MLSLVLGVGCIPDSWITRPINQNYNLEVRSFDFSKSSLNNSKNPHSYVRKNKADEKGNTAHYMPDVN